MILYLIMFLVLGAILRFIILAIAKSSGRKIRRKFVNLGEMKGKTFEEIKKQVRKSTLDF
jgi:F0F1-type ATP synthase membrane subunit a